MSAIKELERPASRLLNARRIAERLGVSAPYVRMLWDNGRLPFVELPALKLGRRVRRIDAAVLESWIADRTLDATGS